MRNETNDMEKLGLIEELELSEPTSIARIQVTDGVKTRATVRFEPGSRSQRDGSVIELETRELSRQRVRVVGGAPLAVGDVYVGRYEGELAAIGEAFALCVASRLLPDRDYESQLEFFVPVDLAGLNTAD